MKIHQIFVIDEHNLLTENISLQIATHQPMGDGSIQKMVSLFFEYYRHRVTEQLLQFCQLNPNQVFFKYNPLLPQFYGG